MPSALTQLWRRVRDSYDVHPAWNLVLPLGAFVLIGLICSLASLAFDFRHADPAYFVPLTDLLYGAVGRANSPTTLNTAVRFGTMYCLATVFVTSVRAGYFALGFEGALLGFLGVVIVLSFWLTGSLSISLLGSAAGSLVALIIVAALFLIMSRAFYSRVIDDVTPGIVLNVVALPVAAAMVAAFHLQDPAALGVATMPSPDAFMARGPSAQKVLAAAIIWSCVGLGYFLSVLHSRTAIGLHLRALGINREAADLVGVSIRRVAILVSGSTSLLIGCAALFHYLAYGRLQVDALRDQIVGPITAAIIGRLSLMGLTFGVLSLLGLSEFSILLQHKGAPPETVLALQGILLLIFAFIVPLRRAGANG